ncbi:hypothetical protein [Arcticibacter eurypsychrophilus]|uniref:hypothetical protein n=1 Tax=Arcticibacter eurypsychrophilus TaxID=1434752 RepID=UPI00084D134E|nr:hypothetical protein [Arcticibacter eurypsychrophilus]
MDTMLIQLTNQKAAGLLHELEELHLIKVLEKNNAPFKTKLSDKYKGIISKEQGQNLNEHLKKMRSESKSIDNIKAGLEEMQLFTKGQLQTTSAKDFLNEL